MSGRVFREGQNEDNGWSRRELLRAGGIVAAVGTVLPIAACTSSSPRSEAAGSQASHHLVRGGTLRMGTLGGSSSDSIVASVASAVPDFARLPSLYNTLLALDENSNIVPSLAESVESTPDASTYTIRLRQGATFHNGKTVTAEDVLFTFQRIKSQDLGPAPQLSVLNLNNAKALDARTVRVKLDSPSVLFQYALAAQGAPIEIVPVGYNPKAPVGTGPFKYQSFTPGQESTFVRNPDYFVSGLPYLDTLQIIDYPDADARFDAFRSGQLDAIDIVPASQISELKGLPGIGLLQAHTGLAPVNYMRTDAAPFNDARVRLAMKLIVDRPKMIAIAGDGYATLANDVLGKFFPSYDTSLPQRHQDLDRRHRVLIGLSIHTARSAPRRPFFGRGAAGTGAVVAREVLSLHRALDGADVTVDGVLGPGALAGVIADVVRPGGQQCRPDPHG